MLDDRPTAPVPQARPNGVPRTKRAVVDERSRAAAQRPPVQHPPVRYHGPTPEELRLDAAGRSHARRFSTLGPALLTTLLSTLVPGAGHLALRRYRTGAAIMAAFVLGLLTLLVLTLRADRSDLIGTLLSSRTLVGGAIGLLVAALAWMAVIVRTYLLARPTGLRTGQRLLGAGAVAVLCLTVAAPLGFGAELANSQRQLLERLFPSLSGGTPAAEAIGKARLNVLLVGSDAGPDRRGTRTDTMMVASVDTHTGRTILFGLPRNLQRVPFPLGSPMAREFPQGFHNPSDPLSGDYLLNAVYAYAHSYPQVAPAGPTTDPGLNLLHSTVETMLGLKLDYYVEVNMAGFAAIIDALGGLTVDVGPEPLPVGGITPTGRHVKPDRYIPAGTAAPRRHGHARGGPVADEQRRLHADGPAALPAPVRPAAEEPGEPAGELPGRRRGHDGQRVDQHPPAGPSGAGQGGRRRRKRGAGERVVRPEPGRSERAGRPVRHLPPGRRVHEEGRARHHRRTAADGRSPGRPDQRPAEQAAVRVRQEPGDGGRGRPDIGPPGADGGRHLPCAIVLNQV